MINFFRSIPLHIKSALKSIKRRFGSALSSIFAVTVTLVLILIFLVIAFNLNTFTKNVENDIRIFVQTDPYREDLDYEQLEQQIKEIPGVQTVEFSSKEEQFEIFVEDAQGGKDYEVFRENNPLPAAYYVEVDEAIQIEDVNNQIRALDGIREATYGGDGAAEMIDAFEAIRTYGAVLIISLSVLAIFLISNTIKMNIHARRDEISIMRYVGASNWFIKMPFLIEGMLLGLFGSILPILLTCFGYQFIYNYTGGYFFTSIFPLLPVMPFILEISLILLGIGVIVGLVGSLFSVNKTLKWKR